MKKIFTLISMALVAMSVNAQTPDFWDVASEEAQALISQSIANPTQIVNDNYFSIPQETKIFPNGTNPDDVTMSDGGVPAKLYLYEFTVDLANIKFHAVSTPNSDAKPEEAWQTAGGGNQGLNTDDCAIKFEKYVKPKNGNPSILYKEYYEETDNGTSFRVKETLWTPESGVMPAKGLFYEFTPSANGELLLGIIVWRPGNQVYVFEKSTMTQFPTSALSIDGYVNNNTVIWGSNEKAFSTIQMTDNHDYQVAEIPGKQIIGYMKLAMEANKTYVLLSPNGQPGIYGFQFTTGEAGISTLKAEQNVNAPIYNLAGQKVSKDFKGVVLQNGKKFVQK